MCAFCEQGRHLTAPAPSLVSPESECIGGRWTRNVSDRLYGPWCLLRSVDHSDNVHLVGLDVIDDSVGAFQDFPYLWEFDFRDDAAGLGEDTDLMGTSGETVNDFQGVLW